MVEVENIRLTLEHPPAAVVAPAAVVVVVLMRGSLLVGIRSAWDSGMGCKHRLKYRIAHPATNMEGT